MVERGEWSMPGSDSFESRQVDEQLRTLQAQLRSVSDHNSRLMDTLREAREQIVTLKAEIDRLAEPPGGYGVFLEKLDDGVADIAVAGRKMRVSTSPEVDLDELRPGQEVMLNEAMNIVGAREFERLGEIVMFKELLGEGDRALVVGRADEERVVALAEPLRVRTLRAGDSLLMEPRSGYVFEVIPKSEVEELVLEEVPDIDYEDIGGLSSQIGLIRDAVELPYLHPDLFREHQLAAPKGDLAVRPTRMRQNTHRQGGGKLPCQEGGGAHRARRGTVVLPQHQRARVAQQVRGGDRAPYPAGVPAGEGEGFGGFTRHRVLRRDGFVVPHSRIRGVQ